MIVQNWRAEAHIPRGSADAEYRVVDCATGHVIAVVDPQQVMAPVVALKLAEAFAAIGRTLGSES